ncbi:hypothetical protein QQ008_19680 [Fulvivirgaceae bacterium BMA10]|uniref:Uncharacterized protein n=1 Tax=Splendidivirga corallicola TaxID=3051826 RepID=A0ABT8KSA9_9BACT|nr:hypothetical protein [Fulvivirgaceae bacterium BMA10]
MNPILTFFSIFLIGEVVAFLLYYFVGKIRKKEKSERMSATSLLKGALERAFVFLSLTNDFPQSLIVFGALKIATRIRPENKISNDYFLIGNLISLILAVLYYVVWKNF